MDSVCVIDFCGYMYPGHIPCQVWADWHPNTCLVVFGGDWREVPPVYVNHEPTETEADILDEYANWVTET